MNYLKDGFFLILCFHPQKWTNQGISFICAQNNAVVELSNHMKAKHARETNFTSNERKNQIKSLIVKLSLVWIVLFGQFITNSSNQFYSFKNRLNPSKFLVFTIWDSISGRWAPIARITNCGLIKIIHMAFDMVLGKSFR